jgi:hypothetical protein
LLRSPRVGLMVVSSKLPNCAGTLPFQIPVTISEYRNRYHYTPEQYQGPKSRVREIEYYQQDTFSDKLSEVIIFRRE